jgi:L-ascorbate metabolism protein UlaG (beta-lactamase superfamily)
MRRSRSAALALLALLGSGCDKVSLFARFVSKNTATLARPVQPAAFASRRPERADARLAATWVGHATVLVQLDDKFVLTDPVFTSSVGQVSKRLVEPGLRPEHLPRVDATLISHLHFDHLSLGTLDLLEDRLDRLYLPEGGAVYVPLARRPPIELPSWQSHEVDGLRVTAVPVRHNGWRYAGDRSWMTVSYTGYVVEYRGLVVYFGGDTAYTAAFAQTARRFPHIDLAILPIAPIHPRAFMCRHHIDPREALDAFRDLRARSMLAMHFDTFVNSLDEYGEAPRALRALLPAYGLDEQRVAVLRRGEQRVFIEKRPAAAPGAPTTARGSSAR